nr:Transposon Ty3-G Gag-Pol polyprotein [Ipomoea batatas]
MEQFHEIVRILGQIRQHGMNMDDSIAIASIIDRFPPSWKKVHRALMQRKEELTMEQLGSHLYVEEGIRQKESKNKGGARFKKNGKGKVMASIRCWVCNGPHLKKDCDVWKIRKAQMEGKSSGDLGQSEDSWWVDTGATRHVCKDINLYKVYKSLEDGPSLKKNSSIVLIIAFVLEFYVHSKLVTKESYLLESEDGNQNPSEQPWEASISALQQQLNQQAIFTHHSTQALQRSMHQLQQTIDSMRTSPPSMPTQQDMLDPPHIGHHTTLSDSNNRSTHLKFDPPKFSGTDPDGWIFRAQEYFEWALLKTVNIMLSTQALQRSMHQLQQTIDSMRTSPPSMPTQQDMLDPPHIGHHTTLSDSNNRSTHLKFDPPKFSGTDPDGWIFRAQEYFEYNNVSSEQRLRVTSLLMEGEASDWFRWMKNNHLLTSWLDFTTQVKLRFDPSHFEDFVGQLSKLTQLTTVGAYRSAYEKLLNKVTNVPAPVLISMFIAGLKPLIRREVMRAKPSSLTAAFALAHEVEAQQTEFQTEIRATALPAQRRHYPNSTQIAPFPVLNHPQPQQPTAQIQTPSNINRNTPLTLPVKHITPAMRQEKIEKGLCFSCDQKWSRNHKCPNRFLLLEAHEEDIEEAMESNEQLLTGDVSSLNSLSTIITSHGVHWKGSSAHPH